MLPPDVWVREEGGNILGKDPFPSSFHQCQAAVKQKQSMNMLQLRKGGHCVFFWSHLLPEF